MKKIFLGFLLVFLFLFSVSNLIQAADQSWCSDIPVEKRTGGLVPCGRPCNDPTTPEDETEPCTFCDFFVMLQRIFNFLLFQIVPPLAILMIAIGGGMYIIGRGSPEKLSRVKSLFTAVVLGLLIIYGAWILVNTFFMLIGINEVHFQGLPQNWFKIDCP